MNITIFCGNWSLAPWFNNSPGHCFVELAFNVPVLVMLIISTVIFAWHTFKNGAFSTPFHASFWIRLVTSIFQVFNHLFVTTISVLFDSRFGGDNNDISDVLHLHNGLGLVAWLLISLFNYFHSKSHKFNSRGPIIQVCLHVLYLFVSALCYWSSLHRLDSDLILKIYHILNLILTLIHLVSHAPEKYPTLSDRQRLAQRRQTPTAIFGRTSLSYNIQSWLPSREVAEDRRALVQDLGSVDHSHEIAAMGSIPPTSFPGRFIRNLHRSEDFGEDVLGDLEGNAGIVSKVFFYWPGRMITKGFHGELQELEDLMQLPQRLDVSTLENKVQVQPRLPGDADEDTQTSNTRTRAASQRAAWMLIHELHKAFGREFYAIGILKFFGDILLLASPIFLNMLVTFLEDSTEPILNGCAYVGILFLSTFLGAFFSVHYSYLISTIGLKFRGSLVSSVYRKCLSTSLVNMNQYSTGTVVNLLTTDIDRVINFCPSFHEFWSMPVQIGVGMVLLYQQVGIACLTGFGFVILLIPVNKWIANQIGRLSSLMMIRKDARVKLMSELLTGIRSVKLLSWEVPLASKVNLMRQSELNALRGQKYLDAICVFLWAACPAVISLATFATYSLLGYKLTAAKVFTSLALFGILIKPMNAFPWVINGLVEAWISVRRIAGFLRLPHRLPIGDLDSNRNSYADEYTGCDAESEDGRMSKGIHMELLEASFSWSKISTGLDGNENNQAQFRLQDITLSIPVGSLIGVIGPVGSGKSSLLLSLMGELHRDAGSHRLSSNLGRLAYVGQEPWLMRGSVRDNVLLGAPYQNEWYRTVVEACALAPDIDSMPNGDLTQIGERGSTLSGGQRARLSLAQSVYQCADLYLLDDPLAAVDTKVARHIMQHCVGGLLKGKTVMLATHHTHWLGGDSSAQDQSDAFDPADFVLVMQSGKIVDQFSPSDSRARPYLYSFSPTPGPTSGPDGAAGKEIPDEDEENVALKDSMDEDDMSDAEREVEVVLQQEDPDDVALMVQRERMERGSLHRDVYLTYILAVGVVLSVGVLLSLFCMQGTRNLSDWWLAYWIENTRIIPTPVVFSNHTSSTFSYLFSRFLFALWPDQFHYPVSFSTSHSQNTSLSADDDHVRFYLTVYAFIVGSNVAITLIRAFLFAYGGIKAARTIHTKLLTNILKATVSFFDSTPAGRILNRFSSDLNTVDDSLPFILNILLADVFGLVGALIVVSYALPAILLVIGPLVLIYWSLQTWYRMTSRELKRINSVARSPLYAHLSESLEGVCVIRGLGLEARFSRTTGSHLSGLLVSDLSGLAASAWLSLRLQMVGVVMVTSVSGLAVAGKLLDWSQVSMAGLAIAYALSVTNLMAGVITDATNTEKELVAVERCREYMDQVPVEKDVPGELLPVCDSWPQKGHLIFRDVCLRYRSGQCLALDGITFQVSPGERVGVVGRTGSGKSSLVRGLFRLVRHMPHSVSESRHAVGLSGKITVDDVDVRSVPLETLRQRLAVIPQEPFLFSGTVRENLDPCSEHSDARLSDVLSKCHLDWLADDLDYQVGERGRQLSAGQRQLLCLGRALLRGARVVCLDEATSSVNLESERLMQKTLEQDFAGVSLLIIAHRLRTITDFCHRVLILQRGRIVEEGPPRQLAANPNSLLAKMLADARNSQSASKTT